MQISSPAYWQCKNEVEREAASVWQEVRARGQQSIWSELQRRQLDSLTCSLSLGVSVTRLVNYREPATLSPSPSFLLLPLPTPSLRLLFYSLSINPFSFQFPIRFRCFLCQAAVFCFARFVLLRVHCHTHTHTHTPKQRHADTFAYLYLYLCIFICDILAALAWPSQAKPSRAQKAFAECSPMEKFQCSLLRVASACCMRTLYLLASQQTQLWQLQFVMWHTERRVLCNWNMRIIAALSSPPNGHFD